MIEFFENVEFCLNIIHPVADALLLISALAYAFEFFKAKEFEEKMQTGLTCIIFLLLIIV